MILTRFQLPARYNDIGLSSLSVEKHRRPHISTPTPPPPDTHTRERHYMLQKSGVDSKAGDLPSPLPTTRICKTHFGN